MKKVYKILVVNFIIFILGFFIFDIFCFVSDVNFHGRDYVFESPSTFAEYYFKTYKRIFYSENDYNSIFIDGSKDSYFRAPFNTDSSKAPVLIMGCSFAWGSYLSNEQSLMGKIAKYTKRPVYNRSLNARGLNEMLYQLRSDKFYSIVPKPEWFIYVLIPDQIRRTQIPCSIVDQGVYYDKNLKLKPNFNISSLYYFKSRKLYIDEQKYQKYSIEILLDMQKEIKKHWGNDVKCLLLYYFNEDLLYQFLKPKLQKNGFLTYSLSDLTKLDMTQEEYLLDDKVHPSEKAWEILVPELVKKSGL